MDGIIRMEASELNRHDIGTVITFLYIMPKSGIEAVITGELRQIYHMTNLTILSLMSPHRDDQELEEFELDRVTEITKVKVL